MRRLTGSLLTLSLMLSLGCVGLWIRSCFGYDLFHYEARSGYQTDISSIGGKLMLFHSNLYWEKPSGRGMHYSRVAAESEKGYHLAHDSDSYNGRHFWHRLGFRLRSMRGPINTRIHIIFVSAPYWSLAGLFAGFPALQLLRFHRRRWLRRNRQAADRCVGCGYDLRASRDYCPECGAAIVRDLFVKAAIT